MTKKSIDLNRDLNQWFKSHWFKSANPANTVVSNQFGQSLWGPAFDAIPVKMVVWLFVLRVEVVELGSKYCEAVDTAFTQLVVHTFIYSFSRLAFVRCPSANISEINASDSPPAWFKNTHAWHWRLLPRDARSVQSAVLSLYVVRPSVRPSVTFICRGCTGRVTWKVITPISNELKVFARWNLNIGIQTQLLRTSMTCDVTGKHDFKCK